MIQQHTICQLLIGLVFLGLISFQSAAQKSTLPILESIRLNQLGFYPEQSKIAVVLSAESRPFFIRDTKANRVVFEGELSETRSVSFSPKTTRWANFSDLKESGTFVLELPGIGESYTFEIKSQVHRALGQAAIKAFYYQRVSTDLPEEYAGLWARAAGHPDNQVLVHASAASPERPEGTIISAPLGWYDAGDYNKYIVNSGITMGTLMGLYEDFPGYVKNLNLDIPESQNQVPDLLDEIRWNLLWMMDMQDPHDGGVYHKLTTANFEGMVMPHEATSQRYVVAKSTAATLDFAAVMAQASRVFKDYYPDMAISCLKAAEMAWQWAVKHPNVLYNQNEMNKMYFPAIQTGAYGDRNLEDEWLWAASELYVSTHNLKYLQNFPGDIGEFSLPSWGNVKWLGYYSLIRHRDHLNSLPEGLIAKLTSSLLETTETYIKSASQHSYHTVMGQSARDFVWGSNSVAANQGIALIQSYLLTEEDKFLKHAIGNLDYILGRNATGFSYVTGFGHKSPKNPHHRPSEAEPEKLPVHGFLVGGPNPGQQDKCDYPSDVPDESYVDLTCSYASNEIAINWNAPFAYLVNAIEALEGVK
ncbi:glycoside hydrolase family 9 protein [Pararhodonellum marinum]|uniref:glycoside hydrolase family 9 protein n=1 Tax=Pararhodonellum marinum TaxID=2755358 RepID=UPI00188DD4D9|nr:glycoside hydrolase family 9 protein [Pararhodonellum marinum]